MKKYLQIFKVHKEERWLMLCILLMLLLMHGLSICKYYELFVPLNDNYFRLFIDNYHVSGFDPLTYDVVTKNSVDYNVFRHPLLTGFMAVPFAINWLLMQILGINCAIFIVALMQTFFAFYAFLFFHRILRELIGVSRLVTSVLTLYLYSFAYVMLSAVAPDHFIMSMMMLILVIYIAGKHIKEGRHLNRKKAIILFFITAGISLNNGLKVFMANFATGPKRFFRPVNLILCCIIPAALMWEIARKEYRYLVYPHWLAKQEYREKQQKLKAEKQHKQDSIADFNKVRQNSTPPKTVWRQKQGKPIAKGEFMNWTDGTSSRIDAAIENLFGEGIQLHEDYLLGDVLNDRPMIVPYRHWWNYAIEVLILGLFIMGIWCGRRSRLLWMTLGFMALDIVLHMGLGFGINEVYIMSAHWIYALPLATAYIFENRTKKPCSRPLQIFVFLVLAAVTVYLLWHNISLTASYFLN